MFAVTANAQERIESAYLKIKSADEVSNVKFNSIKDFEQNAEVLIDEITANTAHLKADKCEVTVEISLTVTVGVASVTVTGTVTASCATIVGAAKKLRAQLMAIALNS